MRMSGELPTSNAQRPTLKADTVTVGDCTLHHGDCFKLIHAITADHFITDPPYAERTHRGAMTNKRENAPAGYNNGGAKLLNFTSLTDEEFTTITRAMLRASKRWVVMTCDHRHAALTFDWEEHIRLGAWVKGCPMPQITGDRPGSGHESVLVLHKPGKKKWNGGGRAGVWHADVLKDPALSLQPTQKPIKLAFGFINDFTDPGETVCDPFMGSGTTAIACMKTGRKFIGIEKDAERFQNAVERIRREHAQGERLL